MISNPIVTSRKINKPIWISVQDKGKKKQTRGQLWPPPSLPENHQSPEIYRGCDKRVKWHLPSASGINEKNL